MLAAVLCARSAKARSSFIRVAHSGLTVSSCEHVEPLAGAKIDPLPWLPEYELAVSVGANDSLFPGTHLLLFAFSFRERASFSRSSIVNPK